MTEEQQRERQAYQERLQERRAALDDLLGSDGWRHVLLPQLQMRQRELERRCMAAQTIDAVRSCQGAWMLIENLLAAPHDFCAVGKSEPEGKREEDAPRRISR